MANDLTQNPWTLDTSAGGTLFTGYIEVDHFEFIDYIADGDTCQITDRNGKIVWEGNGASDLRPIVSGRIGWIQGINLAQLTNGKVRVYYK